MVARERPLRGDARAAAEALAEVRALEAAAAQAEARASRLRLARAGDALASLRRGDLPPPRAEDPWMLAPSPTPKGAQRDRWRPAPRDAAPPSPPPARAGWLRRLLGLGR